MSASDPFEDLHGARAVDALAPLADRADRDPLDPLVVLAAQRGGSADARTLDAAGLPGARAVLAEDYHPDLRNRLIDLGVLPLELPAGAGIEALGLTDEHFLDVGELEALKPDGYVVVRATSADGADRIEFSARVRLRDADELARLLAGAGARGTPAP